MDKPEDVILSKLATSINEHSYPRIYRRFPFLLRLQHYLMIFTTLRNWYVLRELRTRFKALGPSFRYLDAGSGAGDMILPFLKQYPDAEFVGIDRDPNNVEMCSLYAKSLGAGHATFKCQKVEETEDPKPFDLIACITVLHYVKDDMEALKRFYNSLVPGGQLLFYSPINYQRYFQWYARLRSNVFKSVDYDALQGIQRNYTIESISEKLKQSGFEIEEITFTYGNAGRIGFELQSTNLLAVEFLPNWLFPIIALFYFLLVHPFVLLTMAIDFLSTNKEGNGVLILARRPE